VYCFYRYHRGLVHLFFQFLSLICVKLTSLLIIRSLRGFITDLNAVQIVEGHLVTVTAKDVHAALGVAVSGVTVTSGGLSGNESELGSTLLSYLGRGSSCGCSSHGHALLALAHALVVGIETVVSILDDE